MERHIGVPNFTLDGMKLLVKDTMETPICKSANIACSYQLWMQLPFMICKSLIAEFVHPGVQRCCQVVYHQENPLPSSHVQRCRASWHRLHNLIPPHPACCSTTWRRCCP